MGPHPTDPHTNGDRSPVVFSQEPSANLLAPLSFPWGRMGKMETLWHQVLVFAQEEDALRNLGKAQCSLPAGPWLSAFSGARCLRWCGGWSESRHVFPAPPPCLRATPVPSACREPAHLTRAPQGPFGTVGTAEARTFCEMLPSTPLS